MRINLFTIIVLAIMSFSIIGCGSAKLDTSSNQSITKQGVLSDSRISGITYTCASSENKTDDNGTFIYDGSCKSIRFSIGDMILGTINTSDIKPDGIVYPSDLLGLDRNNTNNTVLTNMLQVLQSLDSDNNPYNGITIDKNISNSFENINPPINLDSNETNNSIQYIVETLAGKTLIKKEYAIAHYEDTLRDDINISVDTVPPAPALFAELPKPTNKDHTSIVINGEIGAKVFINGIDSNITIGKNHSATIILDTTGPDGNITSVIRLQDDQNKTSDDFNATIIKDTIPPSITLADLHTDENDLNVTDVSASDLNGVFFSLDSASQNFFDINSTTGKVTFKNLPDYETGTSYEMTVIATDKAGNSSSKKVTVFINNLNDNPPVLQTQSILAIDEDTTNIVQLRSTDADNLDENFSYEISGLDKDFFSVNDTGNLSLKVAADYETKKSYDINITVSDGELNSTKEIKININNINDNAPVIVTPATISTDENKLSVITLNSNDIDNLGEKFRYSLNGESKQLFDINQTTGELKFKTAPDYETKKSYDINVTVSDGELNSTKELTIDINNIDDVIPQFVTSDDIDIDENTNTVSIEASDDFPLSYSIKSDLDGDLFTIDTSTGELKFKSVPDYENPMDLNRDNIYKVTVKISDTVPAHTQEKTFTIKIKNLDDVPSPETLTGNIISGIVTDGHITPKTTVYIQDANKVLREVKSDENGKFTFDISGLRKPFMFYVSLDDLTRLYSFSSGDYANVNITPITSIIMSKVAESFGMTLDDLFLDFSALNNDTLNNYFNTSYQTVNSELSQSLSRSLLSNFNHFYNKFSYTGYNYDVVLQNYDIALSFSNVALRINNKLFTTIKGIDENDTRDINVSGVVLDNSNQPVSGALVNVYYFINGERYDINTTTSSNGSYSIPLENYRVYNINIVSSNISLNYFNLNTFYSDLTNLQLSNFLIIDANSTVNLSGKIFNGRTKDNIPGVTINLRKGLNNRVGEVLASATSDTQGDFSGISLPEGSYTIELIKDGYYSSFTNKVITNSSNNIELPMIADSRNSILDRDAFATVILTWGSNPRDLDSHMYIAANDDNSSRAELFFGNKAIGAIPTDRNNPCATAGVIASLDLDDISSYGPETTTICQRYPYDIHFYVKNYSQNSYPDVSTYAKVIVRKNDGSTYEIVPPSNNDNNYNYWKVFDIDSSGNIIPISQYQSSESDN